MIGDVEGRCRNCERPYFQERGETGRLCCICRASLAAIFVAIARMAR
jgi:hypothetical protein